MRRGLRVVVVLVVVSAAAGLGWIAGQRVKSPDQIAFETEPPAPSLITVEVQLTELSADVIVRADVGYDDPASLKLSGALGGLPEVLVVTAAPDRGTDIVEGSVAIEISGRPVFLLEGEIPVFRDLRPKAVGPDVLQLEEALARLGYFDGEPDQEWDLATGTAVAAWYESRGYEPNGVSDDEQDRLDQARDRVDTAEDAVEAAADRVDAARDQVDTAEKGVKTAEKGVKTAEKGVETAEEGVDTANKGVETALEGVDAAIRRSRAAEDGVSRARDRLEEAQAALVEAEQGPDELEIRRARSEVLSAEEQVRFAEADAESGSEEADRAIREAEAARESAARAYSLAESRWQSAQTGVHPDGGTVPTAAQMEDLRQAVRSAGLALEAAERGIEQARAARDRKAVEAGSALRVARDRLAIARDSLDDLLAPPDTSLQQRAVEDAQLALDAARSDLVEARTAVDDARDGVVDARAKVDDAQDGVVEARSAVDNAREEVVEARSAVDDALEGVEDARADLEDARADLVEARDSQAELESETGIWIPAGELIFLERLPVRVDLLTAERGSSVSGAFMTVTGSDLAVRGSVAVRDFSLVKEGGEALLDDALLPETLAGEIRLVEDRPGTREVANDRHYLEIVADGIPDELIGKNVKVVIPVGGTEGEVLAVPAAALSATAEGATRVEVEQPDGSTRFVEVEPGLAASGLVEVTPLDGQLREGDLVVVGLASDG